MTARWISTIALLVAGLSLMGCGANRGAGPSGAVAPAGDDAQDPGGNGVPAIERVPFNAADFVHGVDNPYFPLVPGKAMAYSDGAETEIVEVTHNTKKILGVTTMVVHDQVFVDGSLIEDTFDWYAQDGAGNVWYFGEDTKELDHGKVVSTEGSWQAGVGGAMPGIIMLANPEVGDSYAQEDAPDVAEDRAKVVRLGETVTVPVGTFTGCLKTSETTPLDRGFHEYKFYAPGVGVVLEITPSGGHGRFELIDVFGPSR